MDCITAPRRRQRRVKTGVNSRSKAAMDGEFGHGRILAIPVEKLRPSPENSDLYRPVDPADPEIVELARSIKAHGVQEPLIVTADYFIVSGHRRLAAAKLAGLAALPCKVLDFRKDEDHARFMHLLRECNRQRIKTFDEKLREEVVSANPEVAYRTLIEHREERSRLDIETIDIRGEKRRAAISEAKWPFLEAILKIIKERRKFLPLSDRQIHYGLLNDPPLIHASKADSSYRNDPKSYKKLTELLTLRPNSRRHSHERHSGRDAARDNVGCSPRRTRIHSRRSGRVCQGLLARLDAEPAQPYRDHRREKHHCVDHPPRGGPILHPHDHRPRLLFLSPRYDIAQRFRKERKERLVLLMLTDFDPDGEEIAHSFARSLRDDFGTDEIEPIKVALTADQVAEYELPPAMKAKTNVQLPAVCRSTRRRCLGTGVPAPRNPPALLQEAIDQVIDVRAFNHEIDPEKADAARLEAVRRVMLHTFRDWTPEGKTDGHE